MRILMLGNSYIFTNDLPSILAEITGAEVVQNTRGGARLREQLNPETRLGAKALELLQNEKWDYVVLQEMSNGPITAKESFMQSVKDLCGKIRENGAVPVLYATWAYQKDGKQLQKFGIDYDEMYRKMHEAYAEAAEKNHTLLADVGSAFYEKTETENLFNDDGSHPNEAGSNLAAETIAERGSNMLERIGEMHGREVISVLDGSRIGYLGDIEFDTQQAALTAIVVYGRPRFFGLFGRENDCVIPWSAVKTIGEDAVLVDHIPVKRTPKRSFLQNFFENG